MGRKDRYAAYVEPYLSDVSEWCMTCTEAQIAKKLGIAPVTFEKYKHEHPELVAALRNGRKTLAEELRGTLKKKALGFEYTEKKKTIREVDGVRQVVIEEYNRYSPPDTGAIHLLLKNIDDDWRNDDLTTVKMKEKKLELEAEKAEADKW